MRLGDIVYWSEQFGRSPECIAMAKSLKPDGSVPEPSCAEKEATSMKYPLANSTLVQGGNNTNPSLSHRSNNQTIALPGGLSPDPFIKAQVEEGDVKEKYCCGACQLELDSVKLHYFSDAKANASCNSSVGTARNQTLRRRDDGRKGYGNRTGTLPTALSSPSVKAGPRLATISGHTL